VTKVKEAEQQLLCELEFNDHPEARSQSALKKDMHDLPFHATTRAKLTIFEQYLKEWIPVFIEDPKCMEVNIIDFFAGSGTDVLGNHGSPLLIIDVLDQFRKKIIDKKMKVNIIVNERNRRKFRKLSELLDQQSKAKIFNIQKYNESFESLYPKIKNSIKNTPNLIFIDQFGVSKVTPDIFKELCTFHKTDFMFFMSSSFVKRFNKEPEFKNLVGWMGEDFENVKTHEAHNFIAKKYRGLVENFVPEVQVIPFTLKKERNIYGLIFCSRSMLGAEKFLRVAWKVSPENGNANFDIEDDHSKAQLDFERPAQMDKMQKFKREIQDWINRDEVITNKQLYKFTIDSGFLPLHAKTIIKEIRDDGDIEHFSNALIGYDQCIKKNRVVYFRKKNKNGSL
jgi:three-Cys-motif partner protein